MLVFVMCGDHQYTVRDVLETRVNPLSASTIILSFREFLHLRRLPVADYIFADFERLLDHEIEAVRVRFDALQSRHSGVRALNPPEPRFRRLQVSNRLYAAGVNTFRVIPARALPEDLRFPVFARRLDDHNGPVSPILSSWDELRAALAAIDAGADADDDLAVVEVVETRNDEGLHEKMSYFRIGDSFFPGALNATENWVCKGVARDNESAWMRERRMRFLTGNEHAGEMARIFEIAGITYGRADYAMVKGRPEVFEINTNPMVVRPEILPAEKQVYAELVLGNWLKALAAFSTPTRRAPTWVAVPPLRIEMPGPPWGAGRRFVHRVLTLTDLLHRETAVMRPIRAVRGELRSPGEPPIRGGEDSAGGPTPMHRAEATK